MIEKTSGIVLHYFHYGETSVITRVFTRQMGLQSFIVPGVRKARARIKLNVFQPLTLLDLVIYRKEHGGLQHIRELSCPEPWQSIPYNITKTAIAIFLAEMLSSVIKESDPNPGMFDFVCEALRFLDQSQGRVVDFHLVFLLKLSRYLGFLPLNNYDAQHPYFNLKEGRFQADFNGPEFCLDKELSQQLNALTNCAFKSLESMRLKANQRKIMLNRIIAYYRMHLEGLKEIKSHLVLESVLH